MLYEKRFTASVPSGLHECHRFRPNVSARIRRTSSQDDVSRFHRYFRLVRRHHGNGFTWRVYLEILFDTNLSSFDTNLSSFDTNLSSFDTNLSSFDTNLNSFDTNLSSFDTTLSSFDSFAISPDVFAATGTIPRRSNICNGVMSNDPTSSKNGIDATSTARCGFVQSDSPECKENKLDLKLSPSCQAVSSNVLSDTENGTGVISCFNCGSVLTSNPGVTKSRTNLAESFRRNTVLFDVPGVIESETDIRSCSSYYDTLSNVLDVSESEKDLKSSSTCDAVLSNIYAFAQDGKYLKSFSRSDYEEDALNYVTPPEIFECHSDEIKNNFAFDLANRMNLVLKYSKSRKDNVEFITPEVLTRDEDVPNGTSEKECRSCKTEHKKKHLTGTMCKSGSKYTGKFTKTTRPNVSMVISDDDDEYKSFGENSQISIINALDLSANNRINAIGYNQKRASRQNPSTSLKSYKGCSVNVRDAVHGDPEESSVGVRANILNKISIDFQSRNFKRSIKYSTTSNESIYRSQVESSASVSTDTTSIAFSNASQDEFSIKDQPKSNKTSTNNLTRRENISEKEMLTLKETLDVYSKRGDIVLKPVLGDGSVQPPFCAVQNSLTENCYVHENETLADVSIGDSESVTALHGIACNSGESLLEDILKTSEAKRHIVSNISLETEYDTSSELLNENLSGRRELCQNMSTKIPPKRDYNFFQASNALKNKQVASSYTDAFQQRCPTVCSTRTHCESQFKVKQKEFQEVPKETYFKDSELPQSQQVSTVASSSGNKYGSLCPLRNPGKNILEIQKNLLNLKVNPASKAITSKNSKSLCKATRKLTRDEKIEDRCLHTRIWPSQAEDERGKLRLDYNKMTEPFDDDNRIHHKRVERDLYTSRNDADRLDEYENIELMASKLAVEKSKFDQVANNPVLKRKQCSKIAKVRPIEVLRENVLPDGTETQPRFYVEKAKPLPTLINGLYPEEQYRVRIRPPLRKLATLKLQQSKEISDVICYRTSVEANNNSQINTQNQSRPLRRTVKDTHFKYSENLPPENFTREPLNIHNLLTFREDAASSKLKNGMLQAESAFDNTRTYPTDGIQAHPSQVRMPKVSRTDKKRRSVNLEFKNESDLDTVSETCSSLCSASSENVEGERRCRFGHEIPMNSGGNSCSDLLSVMDGQDGRSEVILIGKGSENKFLKRMHRLIRHLPKRFRRAAAELVCYPPKKCPSSGPYISGSSHRVQMQNQ